MKLEDDEENEWSELDEVVNQVSREESIAIGPDFTGQVCEGNRGMVNMYF